MVGWRFSLLHMVPGGLCSHGFSFFLFFFSPSEFGCVYIDVRGHSFSYTTCRLSCLIFYIYHNVDGMYFKIQMRALCSLLLNNLGQLHIEH